MYREPRGLYHEIKCVVKNECENQKNTGIYGIAIELFQARRIYKDCNETMPSDLENIAANKLEQVNLYFNTKRRTNTVRVGVILYS